VVPGQSGKLVEVLPVWAKRLSEGLLDRLDGLEDPVDHRYALRKSIVEPVNGQIKEIGGFRRFGLRGYEKVRCEWALVCTGHNLKKLIGAMQACQCGGGLSDRPEAEELPLVQDLSSVQICVCR